MVYYHIVTGFFLYTTCISTHFSFFFYITIYYEKLSNPIKLSLPLIKIDYVLQKILFNYFIIFFSFYIFSQLAFFQKIKSFEIKEKKVCDWQRSYPEDRIEKRKKLRVCREIHKVEGEVCCVLIFFFHLFKDYIFSFFDIVWMDKI